MARNKAAEDRDYILKLLGVCAQARLDCLEALVFIRNGIDPLQVMRELSAREDARHRICQARQMEHIN